MRWFSMALFLVSCTAPEHLPPAGGGGGVPPVGQGGADAAVYGTDASGNASDSLLVGRLCRITDLRYPPVTASDCQQNSDMSGIEVRILDTTTYVRSEYNSRFELDLGAPQDSVILLVGSDTTGYVPTLTTVQLGYQIPEALVLPVVDATAWQTLLADLDTQLPDGTGAVVAYIRYVGTPVVGVEVSNVSAAAGVFYDYDTAPYWRDIPPTGARGAALVLGVNSPSAEITVVNPDTGGNVVPDIPVAPDAITLLKVELTAF